jgi:AcrR family transcriptional regulator
MPRPRSDLRPRIITAARTLFLRDGVDGASLRAIARDAGTNIGMVYYYFPSKEDLFFEVVEDVYARILDDIGELVGAAANVESMLNGLSTRIGNMSPEEFAVVRILLREALGESPRLPRIVERFQRGHIPLIVGAVTDGVARGELTDRQPLPVVLMALVTSTAFPQLVRHLLVERLPELAGLFPDVSALTQASLDLALRGASGET